MSITLCYFFVYSTVVGFCCRRLRCHTLLCTGRGGVSSMRGLGPTMTTQSLGPTMTTRGLEPTMTARARVSVSRSVCHRKHWLCLDWINFRDLAHEFSFSLFFFVYFGATKSRLWYKRHPSTTLRNLTLKKDFKRSTYQHFQFTGEYSLTNS
jgi:hypothetical protein